MNKASNTILFVRMDRLGDLILSLPADELLTGVRAHWFITPGLEFVLDHASPRRNHSKFARQFSPWQFWQMIQQLRRLKVSAAVVYHAPWWVGLALCLARVPLRVGRYSQWHSFLFFNRGLRQKRSRGEKHELEYNLELTQQLPAKWIGAIPKPSYLQLQAKTEVCERFHLKKRSFVVIHPGMGGSALNWPSDHYIELISELSAHSKVVLTGTASDEAYLAPLRPVFECSSQVIFVDKQLSGPELISLLSEASVVVAPSTGVVHLAASTGTPTIGLYSPLAAESSSRWGPKGPRTTVFEAVTTETTDDPMASISVSDVLTKVKSYL